MQLVGRGFRAGSGYRYGFNGKELDQEVVQYDYGFRSYDPRLGKFISIDLKFQKYPGFSPYSYGMNNPVYCIDIDGNDIIGLLELTFKNNFPQGMSAMGIIKTNEVYQKLTANFSVGGMYDKNKIDLRYSNLNGTEDAKGYPTQLMPGSYKKAPKAASTNVGQTFITATVKGKGVVSLGDLLESDLKNIERWQVNIAIDGNLYADGAMGTVIHETSTHALNMGKMLNNFVSGNSGLSLTDFKNLYLSITEQDKTSPLTTNDHRQIGCNTGEFKALSASVLNQMRTVRGALATDPNAKGEAGIFNTGNASKYTLIKPNAYNYLVNFLNGMIDHYSGGQGATNGYLPSTRNRENTASEAPKQ